MTADGCQQAPPARAGARRATSIDVARHAGVSRATVSHILNDQVDRFAPTTVEKVRIAAAELGYVRSAAARALVKGRSDFVVLVVPPTTVSNLQDLVDVLTADLDELGFSVVVQFAGPDAVDQPAKRLRLLVDALRPAGLVDFGWLAAEELLAIQDTGCPVISSTVGTGGSPIGQPDANIAIGRLQGEHLYHRGYREIAYASLSDQRDDTWGRQRMSGVTEVCVSRGLRPPARVDVPLDPAGARTAVEALLGTREAPVGVACYSDEVAIALLFAATDLGFAIPAAMGLIGLEHGPVGQVVLPRLSTVRTDVPASLGGIRRAIADSYRGAGERTPVPTAQVFSVVEGETT